MTVFVITRNFDCEGESPVGVAASPDVAKKMAERQAVEYGYEDGSWATMRNGQQELQFGSTQWVIREEEVRGM